MTAVLEFIDAAAVVLAGHATYTWNKAGTRIRCNGEECRAIFEAPGGGGGAVLAFARHQAEHLPTPVLPEARIPDPVVVSEEPGTPETPAITEPTVELEPANPVPDEQIGEHLETEVEEKITKTRRDTKALAATIAEINKGDRVTAFFKHPVMGISPSRAPSSRAEPARTAINLWSAA
jgi:hypothetical protein